MLITIITYASIPAVGLITYIVGLRHGSDIVEEMHSDWQPRERDENGFAIGSAYNWRSTAEEAQRTCIELKSELASLQDLWIKQVDGTLIPELTNERDALLDKLTDSENQRRALTDKVRDLDVCLELRDRQIKSMKDNPLSHAG